MVEIRAVGIALHEHRASLHGLTFQDVATALRAANDGLVPSTFKDPMADEDIDIRVLLVDAQRTKISDLLEIEVRAPAGHLVKLGDVARVDVARGFQRLYHFDGERALIVYADVDGLTATSTSVNEAMRVRFSDLPMRFPGVAVQFGGENEETRQTMEDLEKDKRTLRPSSRALKSQVIPWRKRVSMSSKARLPLIRAEKAILPASAASLKAGLPKKTRSKNRPRVSNSGDSRAASYSARA